MLSKDCCGLSKLAERLESKTQPVSLHLPTQVSTRIVAAFFIIAVGLQLLSGAARAAGLALGAPNPGQIVENAPQGGPVAIPVTLTRDAAADGAGPCTVTGQLESDPSGTATALEDFRAGSFTVTLPANVNTATGQASVTVIDDDLLEGPEAGALLISAELLMVGGDCIESQVNVIPSPNAVTFTIIDNEGLPVSDPDALDLQGGAGQTVGGTLNVSDDAIGLSFTAELGSVTPEAVDAMTATVTYSFVIPTDAEPGQQLIDTVVITDSAQNQTPVLVNITVVETQAPTSSEGDSLTINSPPGQSATRTFTVSDDAPGIDIAAGTGMVVPIRIDGTSGAVTYTFPVPADASPGEQFADTITLTDSVGNVNTLAVAITAAIVELDSTQEAMNNALLALCPGLEPGTELAQTCANLPPEGTQERADLLSQIAPDELSSQSTMAVEASNGQAELVGSRLSALRTGATGVSLSGLNINLFGQHLPSVVWNSMLPRAGASGDDPGASTRFGFFVNGNVRIGDKDKSFNEPGFDFEAFDATLGLDYRFTPSFVFGGALGYGQAETDFENSAGNIELDGYKLSLYGTWYRSQALYVDGIATIGFNSYDTRRRITLASISENAVGDTDGSEISAAIGGGYDFTRDALVFGPFGRVNYLQVDIDGYQEGATGSGLELRLNDQEVTSITAAIGGKVIYNISTTLGVISPQLNVEYEYELDNERRLITGVFANDPAATVWGFPTDEPDRDVFNVGVGGSATLKNGSSGFLFFETMLGHDNVSQYSITGGLRFEF